jgi:GR25 family glycosyltransferase involved in LPS biosynthesis
VVPVLIINLERDAERRNAMTARLNALGVVHNFLKAVDGRGLSAEDLARASPREKLAFARPLIPTEIGCGMSHLAAVAEGLRLGNPYFCVLEDDAIPMPRLADCLDEAALRELPPFDVLRLFTHLDRWEKASKTVATIAGTVVIRALRPGWGAAGQIYSREGALKVASSLHHVSAPFDYALYHDCHVNGLRVLEMRPGLVVRDAVPSAIGDRSWDLLPPTQGRIRRGLNRWRRKFIAARSFLSAWGVREYLSYFPTWR